MDLKPGMGWIGGPVTDFGKNIGNTTVKWIETDVYRPRTGTDTSMIAYDPTLDPLLVGGSSCKKLGDTLNIKMFECTLNPGQKVPLHVHPDHSIYILEGGKMAFTPKGGARQEGEVPTGAGWINPPITDSSENIGNKDIRFLEVDVYRPRG
jgi:quercetin dioxygenase-like cupin family protein